MNRGIDKLVLSAVLCIDVDVFGAGVLSFVDVDVSVFVLSSVAVVGIVLWSARSTVVGFVVNSEDSLVPCTVTVVSSDDATMIGLVISSLYVVLVCTVLSLLIGVVLSSN